MWRNGCNTPWSMWAYGGTSYFSLPIQSLWGISEGVTVGYRFDGTALGLYGNVVFNHTEESTQVLGTVGLQKFGNPNGAFTFGNVPHGTRTKSLRRMFGEYSIITL